MWIRFLLRSGDSRVISRYSEFVSIWEVYIEIVDSGVGSGVVAVIACMNDLSARFAAIFIAVVWGKVPMDAKNDSVLSELGVKGVNWSLSIVRPCSVSSGYSSVFSGYELLG